MASRIMSIRAFGLMGVILAVAVAAWVVWERAWTSDLDDLNRQVAELYRQGQYAKATELALRTLRLAEARFGADHRSVGRALNNLALLYRAQGRYAEAEPLHKRDLAISEKALGPDHLSVGTTLNNLAVLYRTQGRFAEAEPLYLRALAIREKALGLHHTDVGQSLNNLAGLYADQGRYAEAEALYKRAAEVREKALGPDHPDLGTTLNNLATLYNELGRHAEAEPLYKRDLAIAEKVLGPDHPYVATTLHNLAQLYQNHSRYSEAEALYKRSLAIREKALGPDHPDVGRSVGNLATLYYDLGRYAEAESLYKRDLAIAEKTLGPDHPEVGTVLNNLAELYRSLGRYADATAHHTRSLAIYESALGKEHRLVATSLNNLALVYENQGRYADAERLHRRALRTREKTLGADHESVAGSLSNLAVIYGTQGRYAEAEALHQRSLAVYEKSLGQEHPLVSTSAGNLAQLYWRQRRYTEAEPLYRRSLTIREKVLGPDHSDVGRSLHDLALLYDAQGRYAEAEPLYKRSLTIAENALGPNHRDVSDTLNDLAGLLALQGRHADARFYYQRSLAIRESVLGPDHPDVGVSLSNLAWLFFGQQDWAIASDYWRRSTDLVIRRSKHAPDRMGEAPAGKTKSEAERASSRFRDLVRVSHRLPAPDGTGRLEIAGRMFMTAQWALASDAATSLAQMAARQAKGDGALAHMVRERQDLVGEWQARDKQLIAAVSKPPEQRNAVAEQEQRARLTAIDTRIAEIDRGLAKDFPDYMAFASPEPLSIAEAQAQLRADEALVLFLDTRELRSEPEETFTWIITKTEVRWVRSELGTKALAERIAALRCGLDATLWNGGEAQDKCVAALKVAQPPRETIDGQVVEVLPFDLIRAYELYKALIAPVEDLIKDKHLLVVPSGPLTSLPFHVLVAEAPAIAIPNKLAEYRSATWLAMRQPITVLPSVASLRSLRQFAKASRATKAYLGVGNPLLDGPQNHPQWGAHYKKLAGAAHANQQCTKENGTQHLAPTRGRRSAGALATPFRGGQADIEEVRAWTPLPETADELCEVGRRLGVTESEILLGSRATETALKGLSENGHLAVYAILHFATHGALTGQVQGLTEPGLVLTPPAKGTSDAAVLERDDGFLTASEIAALKLDADWVVLSACNTAGGSGETAEPLSGMARAFFYAGARALLVSHWEVGSDAAVKLTTSAFAELKSNPRVGRAEALRLSMRALIEKGTALEAHPSQWAPFVVVGEGAAAK
jgi:tetratricopeptide (TPR) repeat protein/CHAT domain-containing protein